MKLLSYYCNATHIFKKEASRGTSPEELLLAALFHKNIALETFTEVRFSTNPSLLFHLLLFKAIRFCGGKIFKNSFLILLYIYLVLYFVVAYLLVSSKALFGSQSGILKETLFALLWSWFYM